MIAQRFRPIGWVLGIALAIMLLYVIQLKVATERVELNTVESEIAIVSKDIKRLETEFKTRASMRQLERWNGSEELLALSAPQARQYLPNEDIISELGPDRFVGGSYAPPPPMVLANEQTDGDTNGTALPTQAAILSAQDRAVQKDLTAKPEKVTKVAALGNGIDGAIRTLDKSRDPKNPPAPAPVEKARP